MHKLKKILEVNPFYLLLLPVFFVLHGYSTFYNLVPVNATIIVGLKYIGVCLLLVLLFYFFFKNFQKASIFAFIIMCYNLFFGPAYDFLKKFLNNSFITRYTYLFLFSALLFIVILVLLKKTKKDFSLFTKYLNILLLILIVVDVGNLFFKSKKKATVATVKFPKEIITCDTCLKPDIYLIVADEYANNKQLKEILHFDNSQFEKDLAKRGFHIVQDSKSNYNSTPFSIASLLSMDYLDSIGSTFDYKKLETAYGIIDYNPVTKWFQQEGYQIKNYSIFPVAGIPNLYTSTFFTSGTDLFTLHTLTGRFNKDIRWNFIVRFKIKSEIKKFVKGRFSSIQGLLDKTVTETTINQQKPRFIYLHNMMPHYPYLMDKNGKPDYEKSFIDENKSNVKSYTEYLQYSNKIFINLIDTIKKNNPTAIILFLGDHGFRHLEENISGQFMGFNSIYLPDKNYAPFYNGMSLVNQFRVLLNTQFNQKLPLLADSTIFLKGVLY